MGTTNKPHLAMKLVSPMQLEVSDFGCIHGDGFYPPVQLLLIGQFRLSANRNAVFSHFVSFDLPDRNCL